MFLMWLVLAGCVLVIWLAAGWAAWRFVRFRVDGGTTGVAVCITLLPFSGGTVWLAYRLSNKSVSVADITLAVILAGMVIAMACGGAAGLRRLPPIKKQP